MSGKSPRRKGDRVEREIVNAFLDAGVSAERVPLSGAAGGSYIGDLTFACRGDDWLAECKARSNGWVELRRWIAPVRVLFLRPDREQPLVVLRLSDFINLTK